MSEKSHIDLKPPPHTSKLFPSIIPSDCLHPFPDILSDLNKKLQKIRPSSTAPSLSEKSASAVEEVFQNAKANLGASENPEKVLLNFNSLFREANSASGILEVASEIHRLAEEYQPSFMEKYEDLNKMMVDRKYDQAIELAVELLQNIDQIGRLPKKDVNYVLDIQYNLGCLYVTRDGKDDLKLAKQLFWSFLDNSKFVMETNPAFALRVVHKALHGLSLVEINDGTYHCARIYLEEELNTLDQIQSRMLAKRMALNSGDSLSRRYMECFRCLGRVHDLLGNEKESVFFFERATLAKDGLNFLEEHVEERNNFVKELIREEDRRKEGKQSKVGEEKANPDANPPQINAELSDNGVKLKEGELFVPDETLKNIRRDLDWRLAPIFQTDSVNQSTWRFHAPSYDPFAFLETLNARFIEEKDTKGAAQELYVFSQHFAPQ